MNAFDVELLLAYIAMMLGAASALVWAIFIRDFIRGKGGKPAFALFNWSPILDYRKARSLAKRSGHVPWFLRSFEVMLGTALLMIVVMMFRLVLDSR
jgi:hypothetical protein